MRIGFITNEYITEDNFDGGLANYIHRTALTLKELGHEPIIIVCTTKNESFIQNGILIIRVHTDFNIIKNTYFFLLKIIIGAITTLIRSWIVNRKIEKLNNVKPFDIVQFPHLGALALYSKRHIPSVIRISSYTPMIQIAYNLSGGKQQHFWETMAMKRVNGIFCPSILISQIVQRKIGKPVTVVESPFIMDVELLDTSLFQSVLQGKRYLLFFGTVGLLKGVAEIAEIIYPLLDRHPDLHFVFAGKEFNGPDNRPIMTYVRERASYHENRVIYLGKIRHEVLYPIIQNAEFVVLPSRVDNFPNTCIEAMAFGKIVIGTHGTSFDQLIIDGQNGFLCNNYCPSDLLRTIEKVLLLTDAKKKTISKKALERADTLNPQLIGEKLINYYQTIIASQKVE